MLEHIIKNGETLENILDTYRISFDELKKYNSHITDYVHLLSGTKLMIPILREEIEQILDRTEAFVMQYYPKITEEIIPNLEEESIQVESREEPEKIPKMGTPYPGIIPPKGPYKGR